ncbi:MAG: ATP-binding protein [Candidatus Micrarchaeota archaeon]
MEIKELLLMLNEWWRTNKVSLDRLKKYKREPFADIKKLLAYRQIILVSGLRRVGKSTVIFQLIDTLFKQKISPKRVLYFSYDEKKEDVVSVLEAFQEITDTDWKKEKIFVFFDEIQKLKDWSSKIKIIYDNFPKIKFVVSGSASLQLEKEAMYNLAGRYFIKEIPPLCLKEYFELKHKLRITNYQLYKSDLRKELEDYLKKPFPEIVSFKEDRLVYEYIKESVISKILKIDLPDVFENINAKLLETLLDIFYKEPGLILNLDSLSRDLKIHKKTLEQHIFLLEFSKLIRIVKNYRISILAESRKLRKVYPFHISLTFPFNPRVEEGRILESAVASKIEATHYWRKGNKEVDFIIRDKENLPIEVKSRIDLRKEDLNTLIYFMKKFRVKKGVVIYNGETKKNAITMINILDFLYGNALP